MYMLLVKRKITALTLGIITIIHLQIPFIAMAASLNDLELIERNLFFSTYLAEPAENRLSRIENEVFGRTYNESVNSRLERLSAYVHKLSQPSVNSVPVPFKDSQQVVQAADPATDYPNVTAMENKVFRKNFKNESIYSRLNRLESRVFGTISSSTDLAQRVDRLNEIVNDGNNSSDVLSEQTEIESDGAAAYNNLAKLEYKLFGRSFNNELVTQRLERIESKIFGRSQSGTIDERIKVISGVAQKNMANTQSNVNNDVISFGNTYNPNYTGLSSFSNDSFFQEESDSISPSIGIFDVIKTIALPLLLTFLGNKNRSNDDYYQNQYGYPNYYNQYPYQSGYMPNYYNSMSGYSPYGGNGYYNNRNIMGGYGAGVRIIP